MDGGVAYNECALPTSLTSREFERLRVVLVASRNPLNIGAAARAMSNFGFSQLRVVNAYAPAFREARSAVGASELLQNAEVHADLGEALADCALVVGTTAGSRRVLQLPLRPLNEGARRIRKQLRTKPVALLFGSERVGLSNEDMSHCHWLMHIPTDEAHVSMNLGQAVAVCLYELAREAKASSAPAKEEKAVGADVERVTELLSEILKASGYPGPAPSNELKIRRLVRRMGLSALDAEVWQGVLRQITWKIGSGGKTRS
jgi:TrmH family RNA methyltransferase